MSKKLNRGITGVVLAFLLAMAPQILLAQLELPRVSPRGVVTQRIGLTDVTITYSRPGVKGRQIWGKLVPYNKVWRTGANEATTISFSTDAEIDGKKVPAGTYALFTIPTPTSWTIILNKEANQWGAFSYKPAADLLRIKVTPKAAPHEERMRFSFENLTDNSADVVLRWKKLSVAFPIKVDVQKEALSNSRKAIAHLKADDWQTPFSAANYCLNAGINFDEALSWAEKSTAINKNFLNMSVKAKLLAKLNRKSDAIAAAKEAIHLGKTGKRKRDTSELEKLVVQWQK